MSLKLGNDIVIDIDCFDAKGWGVCSTLERPIKIRKALPGDTIRVKLIQKRRGIFIGKTLTLEKKSFFRESSFCSHSTLCGGCQYPEVSYENQLNIKQSLLDQIVSKDPMIASVLCPIIPAKEIHYYRNKMEFSFALERGDIVLGLKKQGSFHEVVPLQQCYLQSKQTNDILAFTTHYFNHTGITVWDKETNEGCLRFLMIRHAKHPDTFMVNVVVSVYDKAIFQAFAQALTKKFQNVTSVYVTCNARVGDSTQAEETYCVWGETHLFETIGTKRFAISPQSFFQTNTKQASVLLDTIKTVAECSKTDTIMDLYCGTGTIGLYLSDQVRRVYGVEENPDAIADARLNARLNNVSNCEFILGRVKNILKAKELQADWGVIDPPRSGMVPKALRRIGEYGLSKLVYVSCNPTTFFDDVQQLKAYGYVCEIIQPIDMFPHTVHMELVARLRQKG